MSGFFCFFFFCLLDTHVYMWLAVWLNPLWTSWGGVNWHDKPVKCIILLWGSCLLEISSGLHSSWSPHLTFAPALLLTLQPEPQLRFAFLLNRRCKSNFFHIWSIWTFADGEGVHWELQGIIQIDVCVLVWVCVGETNIHGYTRIRMYKIR